MTPGQIRLIKESWDRVIPVSEVAAAVFYRKLFELAPELKSLFKGNIKEYGETLILMLDVTVKGLENLSTLIPAASATGTRFASYGIKDKDYDVFAEALLWTFKECLGDIFNKELTEAWTAAYIVLSMVMKDAAREAA